MGKNSSLCYIQIAQIVTLHGVSYTGRKISVSFCCNKTPVNKATVQYQNDGSDIKTSGFPTETVPKDVRILISMIHDL